ncbi:major pollen allergen Cor a 1 isoforms 5, 6, 11 and 16-like [Actinidia eriantha]|uniref:major pollen allergen Cor a 1 isoforms 5, 6, 11 and 16-like n=1 Tax=Actinidia eriantha TaxID=165200 RepID=UPI00258662E7|nr:major pollen allergen Cor a 1 isoforms 5, 6, 11 and 16-like [Actinidia eriantha]
MGVFTYCLEIPLIVPPAKMFEGLIRDGHSRIPRVVPSVITNIQTNEDQTTVVTFGRGSPFRSVKLRTNATHAVNFTCSCILFEGDVLRGIFESISYRIEIKASPNRPNEESIYKCWTTFVTNDDHPVPEMDIQSDKAYQTLIVKAIEAQLHENRNY